MSESFIYTPIDQHSPDAEALLYDVLRPAKQRSGCAKTLALLRTP